MTTIENSPAATEVLTITLTRRLEFEIAEYPTWEEPFTMETARAHGAHNIREIAAA